MAVYTNENVPRSPAEAIARSKNKSGSQDNDGYVKRPERLVGGRGDVYNVTPEGKTPGGGKVTRSPSYDRRTIQTPDGGPVVYQYRSGRTEPAPEGTWAQYELVYDRPEGVQNNVLPVLMGSGGGAGPIITPMIGPVEQAQAQNDPNRFRNLIEGADQSRLDVQFSEHVYPRMTTADPFGVGTFANIAINVDKYLKGGQSWDVAVENMRQGQRDIQEQYYQQMNRDLYGENGVGQLPDLGSFVIGQVQKSPLTEQAALAGIGYGVGGAITSFGGLTGRAGAGLAATIAENPRAVTAAGYGLMGGVEYTRIKGFPTEMRGVNIAGFMPFTDTGMESKNMTGQQQLAQVGYDVLGWTSFGSGFKEGLEKGLPLKYARVTAKEPSASPLQAPKEDELWKGLYYEDLGAKTSSPVNVEKMNPITGQFEKMNFPSVTAPSEIKGYIGEAKGLATKLGITQPLIGRAGGKWALGDIQAEYPKGFDQMFRSPSAIESRIFETSKTYAKLPGTEQEKFASVLDFGRSVQNVKGGNLKQTPFDEIKPRNIPEKFMGESQSIVKENKDLYNIFGSTGAKMRSAEMRGPGDYDINIPDRTGVSLLAKGSRGEVAKAQAKAIVERLNAPGEVRATDGLVEFKEPTGQWAHGFDIHDATTGVELPDIGFGFKSQAATKVQGFKVQQLGEQVTRKASSILGLTGGKFGPEAHRVKDVGDLFATGKQAIISVEKSVPGRLGIGGVAKLNAKLGRASAAWGVDLSTITPAPSYGAPVSRMAYPSGGLAPLPGIRFEPSKAPAQPKQPSPFSGRQRSVITPKSNPPSMGSGASVFSRMPSPYSPSKYSPSPSSPPSGGGYSKPPSSPSSYLYPKYPSSMSPSSRSSMYSAYSSMSPPSGYKPKISIPPMGGFGDLFGGTGASGKRKKKGRRPSYSYSPTLAGLMMGKKFRGKQPKGMMFTGSEIRFPSKG